MRVGGKVRGARRVPWWAKLAVALAVFGVIGYDTFVTIATHLKAENDAQNAAIYASQQWEDAQGNGVVPPPSVAYDAAAQYLQTNDKGDHVCYGSMDKLCGAKGNFSVDPDGTVHLVVRRSASTLIFKHLGFMHSFLTAFETGDGNQNGN